MITTNLGRAVIKLRTDYIPGKSTAYPLDGVSVRGKLWFCLRQTDEPPAEGNPSWMYGAGVELLAGGGLGFSESGELYVDPDAFSDTILQELQKALHLPMWLTQDTDWYVNAATGDDANDGSSADKAFKTIQACANHIADNFNLSSCNARILIAPGEYDEIVLVPKYNSSTGIMQFIGSGKDTTRVQCFNFTFAGKYTVQGLTVNNKGIGGGVGSGITGVPFMLNAPVTVIISNLAVVADTAPVDVSRIAPVQVSNSAMLIINSGCSITFNAAAMVWRAMTGNNSGQITLRYDLTVNGALINANGATLDLSRGASFIRSTPLNATPPNVVGAVTLGKRYVIATNSICEVGGDSTFFPGAVAGSSASGAQYV
jgi:hypothetical protein